jgi:hypothetical protein
MKGMEVATFVGTEVYAGSVIWKLDWIGHTLPTGSMNL